MKKLLCILLTLLMLLGLTTVAFAEGEDENAVHTTTVTFANPDGVTRTYNGYQLLEATVSLKGDAHHTTHDGEHTADCYNYAYTVNEKYRTILQDEVFANGGNYLWGEAGKPADASKITDDQILKYLENQKTETSDTMPQVADRLYRAIKADNNIEADKTGLKDTQTLDQGYWMFADVTNLDDSEATANSLVVVKTAGDLAITVNPKTALPTVEKKVKDIDDSEDNNIKDNPWQDSADHDIGDTVPFKLTATLPSNAQNYQTYQIVFHDTLSAGLTLKEYTIKVLMYETVHKANVDTDLSDGTVVTDKFTVTTEGLTDGCSFEVSCENVYAIDGVTKDTAFVVYYEATLNENAVIGAEGNPNEVYLEYSNNPYGDSTGTTKKDKVIVFTYQLIVNKTDSHGHKLEGAGFTLYKKDLTGAYTAIGIELKGEALTTFEWKGLDDGDYKLVETTTPEGYNTMEDILFSISATHDETSDNPALTLLDGGLMGTGEVSTGAITKDIVNNTGTVLPETGARGTMMLIACGALFVGVAAVFMITRKKMSIYED